MGVIEASDRAWKVVKMKNEKQGAAEWLREKAKKLRSAVGFSCKDFVSFEFGISSPCKFPRRCCDCYADMFERIADRIESERALPEGVEWPRFEAGEPVKVGDEVEYKGETMRVYLATIDADGWALWCSREGIDGRLSGSYGERVKRPAPKVLDADGVPIKVGDTVYFIDGNNRALIVERIDANGGDPAVDLVYAGEIIHWHSANPGKLTHEPPDSWRMWGEDLDMAVKAGEVDKVEMMRRAKALAKAGEGL